MAAETRYGYAHSMQNCAQLQARNMGSTGENRRVCDGFAKSAIGRETVSVIMAGIMLTAV
jgi:hypothetical protein